MRKFVVFLKLLIETIISLLYVFRHKSYLIKNKIPKMYNEKIFILGNGPSLKENLANDMELLKENDIFCVNTFCLSSYFIDIKPRFYIFLDPAYFIKLGTAEKFIKLQESIIESLFQNVEWNMEIFIPNITDMKQQWYELHKKNPKLKIIYFNNNPAEGFILVKHFLFKRNLALPKPQNVLVGAIYLSINMQYKNVYLLGADHSWTEDLRVNDNNQLYLVDKHFDSEEKKLFYKGVKSKELWKMHEILGAWSIVFKSYNELELYARKSKVNIINLTKESYIDSFKRGRIECIK